MPQASFTSAGTPQPRRKAAGDAAFSVAERLISQGAQFAVFIVAARILAPDAFGVFALASAVAILLLRASEAGWAPFIMSREADDPTPHQVLFVAIMAGLVSGLAATLGALVAGWIGLARDVVLLMILFAGWLALATATSAQKGVLVWMGRLRAASLCEIAGEIVSLVVTTWALLSGAGVFALVYGRLAAQATALLISFSFTRRAPRYGLPRPVLRELWVYSRQIFASRMLVQMRLHFVTLVIGAFLGPGPVGIFRAADRLVGAVAELVMVPGQLIAWSQLRHARDCGAPDERAIRISRQVGQSVRMLVLLGAPPFLWLIAMNAEIVRGLLGPEWQAAAPLVAILALGRLLMFPGILTEPLLTIVGEARRLPAFMAIISGVAVSLTFVAAPFGIVTLAWAQTAVAVVVMVATGRLFARHAGVGWRVVIGALRGAILPLGAGFATILALDFAAAGRGLPDLAAAAGFGLAGCVIYTLALAPVEPAIRTALVSMLRLPAAMRRRPL